MKKLNKILAFVLCAVMLMGLAPVALNSETVVAADAVSSTEETLETGIIQGENDLVILYDEVFDSANPTKHLLVGYLFGLVTGKISNQEGLETVVFDGTENFERVIIVWGQSTTLPHQSGYIKTYTDAHKGTEKLVWTQKCTVNYPENAYRCYSGTASNPRTQAVFEKIEDIEAGHLYNFYDNETPCELTLTSQATMKLTLGCYLEWNYMNFKFDHSNLLVYCQGFDFTVGSNVKFSYADANAASHRPIVVNGELTGTNTVYVPGESFQNNQQTVTLNGGQYQYVCLRSRSAQITHTGITFNLHLGAVRFVHDNFCALFGNDTYTGCTMNVYMNGTDFKYDLYLLGGTESGKSSAYAGVPGVSGTTLNMYINSAYFNEGGGIIGSRVTDGTVNKDYNASGLTVNMFIKYLDNVGSSGVNAVTPEKNSDGNDVSGITSSVYYDNMICSDDDYAESVYNNFDNKYKLSTEDSTAVYCGNSGTNTYKYVDGSGTVASATWEMDASLYHNQLILNTGDSTEDAAVYCRHCLDTMKITPDANGGPTIYVDSVNGHDGNTGYTVNEPKKTLDVASQAVKKWNRGGTVMVCGNSVFTDSKISDAGGELTISSMDNGAGTLYTAQIVNSIVVYTDLAFSNLSFRGTSSIKYFFLNWHNFRADDNCIYNASEGNDSFKLALVSGARGSMPAQIEQNATDKSGIDQKIELNGLDWAYVFAGTKLTNGKINGVSKDYGCNPDLSVNCSGNTNIIVSDGANVRIVDLVNNGVVARLYTTHSSIKLNTVSDGTIIAANPEADTTVINGNFGSVNSEEHVHVIDNTKLVHNGEVQTRVVEGNQNEAVRVGFTTSANWVDTNKVVEFGVVMAAVSNKDNIAYISGTNDAELLVGKSIAYDTEARNYLYNGTDDTVTFRGLLEFNEAGYLTAEFAARPYAVVDGSETVGGKYTVIGDIVEFCHTK
ncbi:MAG: hypothetical protein E7619_04710 [Ruminococcaceae bacterium]|nr:hypothetical protein [Oscillospiraceae bacterium]